MTSVSMAIAVDADTSRAVVLTADAEALGYSLLPSRVLLWELHMPGPAPMNAQRLSPRILVGLSKSYPFDNLLPTHLRAFDNGLLHGHNLVQPMVTFKLVF